MSFNVLSVTQITADILRVEFDGFPKASNSSLSYDALNASNYSIAGPGVNAIVLVDAVSAETKEIDIYLSLNILEDTSWTVSVSNVEDIDGTVVTANNFTVIGKSFSVNSILGGVENQTAQQFLRRNLNPALKGSVWNALLAAIGSVEQDNWDNAQKAFDQLYTTTASGKYLIERGSDYGVQVPYNVVFTDDDFKTYVNLIINKQLTLTALNDMLSLFYGIDSTHATSLSGNNEPFDIADGSLLFLKFDNRFEAIIRFTDNYFVDPTAATALEISTAINEQLSQLQVAGYALPYVDPLTSNVKVKLISETAGLASGVQVFGGNAQNRLLFDEELAAFTGTVAQPTWVITAQPNDVFRFTSTTSPTFLTIGVVQTGDYVNIYGVEFNTKNQGTFQILDAGIIYGPLTQFFDVSNEIGVAETVAQLTAESLLFYRPDAKSIYSLSPQIASYAVQSMDGEVDVILPATPGSVTRQSLSGSYLQTNDPLEISEADSTNVRGTFANPILHSDLALSNGTGVALIENLVADITTPDITAGDTSVYPAITDSSPATIFTSGKAIPNSYYQPKCVRFSNGTVLLTGGADGAGVSVDASDTVSILSETNSPTTGIAYTYNWNVDLTTTLPIKLQLHGLSLIFNGEQAFLSGGLDDSSVTSQTAYFYDQIAGWTSAANMGTARFGHSQVTLADGTVLVIGGEVGVSASTSCEIFDPNTNSWAATGSLNHARYQPGAILLDNGKVLVIGGRVSESSCEIFDPNTGLWTYTGSRRLTDTSAPTTEQAFKLADGRVITVGGTLVNSSNGESFDGYTEIYDPNTGFWSGGPKLIGDTGFEVSNIVSAQMANTGIPYFGSTITEQKYQRIVVFGAVTGGSDLKTQFLESYPLDNYLQYPELKWKQGPTATYADCIDNGTLNWIDGNAFLYSNGLVPPASGATLSSKCLFYIKNCDKWGYLGPVDRVTACSTSTTNITLISRENLDYSSFISNNLKNITLMKQQASNGIIGPYIWDPKNGISVSDPSTYTTVPYYKGNSYPYIDVFDTSNFPDSGYLVINFGESSDIIKQVNAIYPIKYTAILSGTRIQIDGSFVFTSDAVSGAKVSYLFQKEAYDPIDGYPLGSFYLTDTPAARVAAIKALDQIEPAGPEVNNLIVYSSGHGLGGEGFPTVPTENHTKLSDVVAIWAGSQEDVDA